ncbi:hypothetical protein ACM66B_006727 [Microbotryomycetes sp. NB124-2]
MSALRMLRSSATTGARPVFGASSSSSSLLAGSSAARLRAFSAAATHCARVEVVLQKPGAVLRDGSARRQNSVGHHEEAKSEITQAFGQTRSRHGGFPACIDPSERRDEPAVAS